MIEKLKQFKILIFFLFFILLLISTVFILRALVNNETNAPEEAPSLAPGYPGILPDLTIEPPPGLTNNNAFNIIVNFADQTFPSSAPVFRKKSSFLTDESIIALGSSFQFTTEPQNIIDGQGQTVFLWNEENRSLVINKHNGEILYSNSQPENIQRLMGSTRDVINAASLFLTQNNVYHQDLKTTIQDVKLLIAEEGGDTVEADSFTNADLYAVTFSRYLDQKPVYHQGSTKRQVLVLVNPSGTIQSLQYIYPTLEPTSQTYPIISMTEIKTLLSQGRGQIAKIGPENEFIIATPPTTPITLNTIELAFVDDRTTNFIQPIFVFMGEYTNQSGEQEQVYIYLPAIKQ